MHEHHERKQRSDRRHHERRKEGMRYLYAQVIYLLGGPRCKRCGREDNPSVHHVDGITWDRHSVGQQARIRRYRDEALGIRTYPDGSWIRLECLCVTCNSLVELERETDPTPEEIDNSQWDAGTVPF